MTAIASDPNGHVPVLVDTELEQLLIAAVLAEPDRLDKLPHLAAVDLAHPHMRAAFGAIRNVRARGEQLTPATVRAELAATWRRFDPDPARPLVEHPQAGDLAWFDQLAAVELPTGELPVIGWAFQISSLAERRASAIAAADEAARIDSEIDDFALRDSEPAVPTPPAVPKPRWCLPLVEFLGEHEPDDDDRADWIVRDILPRGEAGILAGPPKCGKTWAMLDLGICVALGRPWMGTFDNTMGGPAKVLALAFEDGQRRLRKRVWELARTAGLTPNDKTLQAHLSVSREPLSLPGDERALAAELKTWRPTLVIIDNLTRVMAGDQNAIKDAKRFSDLWCRLCTDVGAAIVFLHHTSKVGPIRPDQRNAGDPFELIRGSGDLVASARHLVLMRPLESPDDDKLADVRLRGNLDLHREDFVFGFRRQRLLDRWTAELGFRGDGEAVRDELAEKRREKAAARKVDRAAARGVDASNSVDERVYARLYELASGGHRDLCTLEQLKESSGVQRAAVRPALDRLIHAGRVRMDTVRRFEGGRMRARAIFVPAESGAS